MAGRPRRPPPSSIASTPGRPATAAARPPTPTGAHQS